MYLYQQFHRFFAQVTDGTAEVATEELTSFGATGVTPGYRGLFFNADTRSLYRVVYCASIPTRVFAPLVGFDCHAARYLYRRAGEVDWPGLFGLKQTFSVHANVSNSAISHSQFAALKVKDAIVDRFRAEKGQRPDVDAKNSDVRVHLYLHENKATISLELGGGSMHRRGYRVKHSDATMQEHVAAAALRMAEWTGETPLHDPMCGSGTFLAEAYMRMARMPSGYLRDAATFGVQYLPDYDDGAWSAVRAEANAALQTVPDGWIQGSDADGRAVSAARTNMGRLPGGDAVRIQRRRVEAMESSGGVTLITNPPYGQRIGGAGGTADFIRAFGDVLKHNCNGSVAFIYFGDRELLKSLGLRTKWKKPLANGGLDGRLVRVDLY